MGKTVSINGSQVKVDGDLVPVDWEDANHFGCNDTNVACNGTVQSVNESLKGTVLLSNGQQFENPKRAGSEWTLGEKDTARLSQ